MSAIKLSVCIPVYNFGAYLGQTLDSIISQATDNVEIVIVDGASTDNTTEVVERYQKTFPRLTYHRRDKRGGIDRDMAMTVELARGEYCWLFSGDDMMRPGALSRILNTISPDVDLILCESMTCDFTMRPLRNDKMVDLATEQLIDMGNAAERARYFERAITEGAFFSYCTSLIFSKAVWDSVAFNESFDKSCWAHVARFFEIIHRGLKIRYIPEPLVDKRSDNDSFLDKGLVNRFKIAIDGFNRLGDTFFGHDSVEALHIRRVIRHEYLPHLLLHAKLDCQRKNLHEERLLLDHLAFLAYSDSSLEPRVFLFIYRYTPLWFYSIIKSAVAAFKTVMRNHRSATSLH